MTTSANPHAAPDSHTVLTLVSAFQQGRHAQAHQGIHVLLDLSGNTAHNPLPLFARRPAPVQASWLDDFAATGVAAMD